MAKTWKEAIAGMTFVDAAVVDKDAVVFALNFVPDNENSFEPGKTPPAGRNKLLFCDLKSGGWAAKSYERGFSFARCAGGKTPEGQAQALFAESGGGVTSFAFPDGPRGAERVMPARATHRLAFVGAHFYSCGRSRGFLRREGPGDWTVLSKLQPKDEDGRSTPNFVALDGLAETDIYLAQQKQDIDGHARVIHWNGTAFTAIPLPADVTTKARDDQTMFINDLIVAPDGRVFVSGGDGELLMGGREGFVQLTPPDRPAMPGFNLCWFKGDLYGGLDTGLFRFDFDALRWVAAPFVGNPEAPKGGPYIDANEDIMVFAGAYSAAVFDGKAWTRIAGDVSALDVTRLQLKEQQVEDLQDLRDLFERE